MPSAVPPLRDGKGRKGSPYRYWLQAQEKQWRQSPFYLPDLPELPELE